MGEEKKQGENNNNVINKKLTGKINMNKKEKNKHNIKNKIKHYHNVGVSNVSSERVQAGVGHQGRVYQVAVARDPDEERKLEAVFIDTGDIVAKVVSVTVWSWVQGQVAWYRNEDKVVVNLVEEDYSR